MSSCSATPPTISSLPARAHRTPIAWKRPASFTAGSLFPSANNGGKLPGISVSSGAGGAYGSDGFGEDDGYIPNGPYNSNPTYTYRDNVTKIVGRHNLQFHCGAVSEPCNSTSRIPTATRSTTHLMAAC